MILMSYKYGGQPILKDLLNERVAEGETFDPHDFNVHANIG